MPVSAILLLVGTNSFAGAMNLDAFKISQDASGAQTYSINIQLLAVMTVLTLLPVLVLMMTSFTRIVIVLSILRQAMGMQQTPSNQIIIGLSLFLSLFIMTPVFDGIHEDAIKPYSENKISQGEALDKAAVYIKQFMLHQTREDDLDLYLNLSKAKVKDPSDSKNIPLSVLIPSFITSELKTAFQIGFIIFIPFLIIDLVVASVLMSMGMMMLSPMIISLPFKIMLFVLVDGWNLIMGTLASSFHPIG